MKRILQEFLVSSFSLFFTAFVFNGLKIIGGVEGYIIGGVFITLGEYILKPILKVITLPFTLLSFGLFSLLINSIILYVITLFYKKIQITSFDFPGFSFSGLSIPSFHAQILLSYFIISGTIYLIKKAIFWIFGE